MVVRGEKYNAFEIYSSFIKALNAFQVKMICWLIKNNTIRILQHHATDHTPNFFTPAQYFCFFHDVVATEKHFSEKPTKKGFIDVSNISRHPLTKPVHQCKI